MKKELSFKNLLSGCDKKKLILEISKHLEKTCDFKKLYGMPKGAHLGVASKNFVLQRAAAILIRLVENPQTQKRILNSYAKKINMGSKRPKIFTPSSSLHRRIRQELVKSALVVHSKFGWVTSLKSKTMIRGILQD